MVGWVLVEAEEVDVGEVSCDGWWNIVLVNLVEDEVEVEFQLWCCFVDEGDEQVDGVGGDAGAFIFL